MNINHKYVVMGAMIAPVVYLFLKIGFTLPVIIAACLMALGMHFFNENFIHKGELPQRKPMLSPDAPTLQNDLDWAWDNEANKPQVKR